VQVEKEAGENNKEKEVEVPSSPFDAQEPELMKDYYDTTLLSFPKEGVPPLTSDLVSVDGK